MLKKIPLQIVLAVPFAVQMIGIVSLVGYLSYRSGQQAVEHLAHQLMAKTSNRVTQDLDGYLQNAHQINQTHIAALKSGGISLENLDQLHRYLILQLQHFPEVTTLLLGLSEGEFRIIHRVSPGEVEAGHDKQPTEAPLEAGRSNANDPSRLDLYTPDEAGNLGRYLLTIENLDVRERPWYRRAVETAVPGWSEPFQIGATNLLTINAYAPFYSASQQLQGVFSVNLTLERLNDFLETLSVTENGQVFVMERDGLLIANSAAEPTYTFSNFRSASADDAPPITQPEAFEFRRLTVLESNNPVMRASAQQLEKTFGSLDAIQTAQRLQMDVTGDLHFLHVIPYQDNYGLDWLIVTVAPQSDFMGEIYANVRRTVWLCGLALAGAIGIGSWTSQRITRSLSRLTQTTQDFATGKLTPSLKPTRVREVATLSDALQQMITALRQAEQLRRNYERDLEQQVTEKTAALRKSTAQLQAAQRIAHVGSWEFDTATGKSTGSDEQFRILGLDQGQRQLGYSEIFDRIPRDDQPKLQSALDAAIAHGVPYEVEHRIIRPDGSIRHVVDRGEAVLDAQGQVIKLVGATTDISDRKQAEEDLKQYRDRLEYMVESRTAELTQANQKLQQEIRERRQIEAALKYQAELEKLISEISNQFINLDPNAVDQGIETALHALSKFMQADRGHVILSPDQSKPYHCIYTWCAPGIEPTQMNPQSGVLGAAAPWLDRQLQQFGVVRISSLTGLPPEASAEKALCQNDGIQSLVAVRIVYAGSLMGLLSIESVQTERHWSAKDITRLRIVAEIFASALERRRSQEALMERTQDLERSNAELEQFAYVASHDLQEPLRAVTSYAQLLAKRYADQLDAKADKYINYIVDGGNRMQRLIQDLLNYSRVGAKGKAFQPTACDQVLDQALANLAIAIRKAGAKITADPLPEVMADAGQLVQLLQNLISNAIKFQGEAPPQIHISAVQYVDERWHTVDGKPVPDLPSISYTVSENQWLFSIGDNGIGIEPDYADRIFTLFQRLHTRKQYPGTGIGLAICKKIVERHGGQIWVESEFGQGSTFYFMLPIHSGSI